jgi:hypothetical protein
MLVQIGLLLPTAHPHRDDGAFLDQLLEWKPHVIGGNAVVVAQIACRRDAERFRRAPKEHPPGVVAARGRHLKNGARQDPLGQVIDALEAAPAVGRRNQPRPEQPFERVLRVAPCPHAPRGSGVGHIGSGQRSIRPDALEHGVGLGALFFGERCESLPYPLPSQRARHAPAQQRLAVDGQ